MNQSTNLAQAGGGTDIAAQMSGGRPSLLDPAVFEAATKMSEVLANSTFVPKDFQGNPGNVLVAIQWGAELGLQPLQAMQNIAVINGRPSLWGDAVIALVRGSGLLESISESEEEDDSNPTAICTVKRRGEPPVTKRFSQEDAKKAGLAGKAGPWQQYPARMRQMRARGFALRDVFPDVLKGMHVAELAQDEPRMRDVTPESEHDEDGVIHEPSSKADKVAQKVSGKKAAPKEDPADAILAKIAGAKTLDVLDKAIADVGSLPEEKRMDVRSAYRKKRAEIEPDPHKRTYQDVTKAVLDGADETVIKNSFGGRLAAMENESPDLHKQLMGEIGEIAG